MIVSYHYKGNFNIAKMSSVCWNGSRILIIIIKQLCICPILIMGILTLDWQDNIIDQNMQSQKFWAF